MEWLRNNWPKLMPLITLLAGIVGGMIGVKVTIKQSNVDQPEINIVIPADNGKFTKVPVTYTATVEEKKK